MSDWLKPPALPALPTTDKKVYNPQQTAQYIVNWKGHEDKRLLIAERLAYKAEKFDQVKSVEHLRQHVEYLETLIEDFATNSQWQADMLLQQSHQLDSQSKMLDELRQMMMKLSKMAVTPVKSNNYVDLQSLPSCSSPKTTSPSSHEKPNHHVDLPGGAKVNSPTPPESQFKKAKKTFYQPKAKE